MIVLRNKTVAHTFPLSFDNANERLSQERLLRSRNFATMVTWRHVFPLFLAEVHDANEFFRRPSSSGHARQFFFVYSCPVDLEGNLESLGKLWKRYNGNQTPVVKTEDFFYIYFFKLRSKSCPLIGWLIDWLTHLPTVWSSVDSQIDPQSIIYRLFNLSNAANWLICGAMRSNQKRKLVLKPGTNYLGRALII